MTKAPQAEIVEPGLSAVFVLESHGDQVGCNVVYEGGFDNECIAHRTAALLVSLMDEHCDKINPAPEVTVKASAPKLLIVDGGRVRKA